jgi:hypothetical protein
LKSFRSFSLAATHQLGVSIQFLARTVWKRLPNGLRENLIFSTPLHIDLRNTEVFLSDAWSVTDSGVGPLETLITFQREDGVELTFTLVPSDLYKDWKIQELGPRLHEIKEIIHQ